MIVDIKIECDDPKEILQHLSVINRQLRLKFKKLPMQQSMEEPREPVIVQDNNCYGRHSCVVQDITSRNDQPIVDHAQVLLLQNQVLDLDKAIQKKDKLLRQGGKNCVYYLEYGSMAGTLRMVVVARGITEAIKDFKEVYPDVGDHVDVRFLGWTKMKEQVILCRGYYND
jgi:hypothetical protein